MPKETRSNQAHTYHLQTKATPNAQDDLISNPFAGGSPGGEGGYETATHCQQDRRKQSDGNVIAYFVDYSENCQRCIRSG